MKGNNIIEFEEGWSVIKVAAIDVLEKYLEDYDKTYMFPFENDDKSIGVSQGNGSSHQENKLESINSTSPNICVNETKRGTENENIQLSSSISTLTSPPTLKEPQTSATITLTHRPSRRETALFTKKDYSLLYTLVYDMCVQRAPHNHSRKLYERYTETIREICTKQFFPSLSLYEGVNLLKELKKKWESVAIYIRWLNRFFTYLDRYHVKMNDLNDLKKEGYHIFNKTVFEPIKDRVDNVLLSLIQEERLNPKTAHQYLLRDIIPMYNYLDEKISDFGYYAKFEGSYLAVAKSHYCDRVQEWLKDDNFTEYFKRMEKALSDEFDRCELYMNSSTGPLLKAILTEVILQDHIRSIMAKKTEGMDCLLENKKSEDLIRTFKMLELIKTGLNELASGFKRFLTGRGNEMIKVRNAAIENAVASSNESASALAARADNSFIKKIIDLHDTYQSIVASCFNRHIILGKAHKDAFETIINQNVGKTSFAYLMAAFCDRLLKVPSSKTSEDKVEQHLIKIVALFGYLSDKDIFGDAYRIMLAKRLQYDTCTSQDAEKTMISHLKIKCGTQFTSKLEGMLNDIQSATDIQRAFEFTRKVAEETNEIEFNCKVLTSVYWPTYTNYNMSLPPELQISINQFSEFYHSQNSQTKSRKLTWIHSIGTASVKVNSPVKYTCFANVFQTCILLLFNSKNRYSVQEILKNVNLGDPLLTRKLIGSCSTNKFPLLRKCVSPVKISSADAPRQLYDDTIEFEINPEFNCSQRRFKLPTPVQEETQKLEKIEEDRSMALQAAIVRIMKARKTLTYQQITSEILSLIKNFQPSPKMIKSNLETLIKREFLERDPENMNVFVYSS